MNQTTIYEDGRYLERNPTWHEEDSHWKAEQIIRILKRNDITPSNICEIGCGAGGILGCLANEYGDDVIFSGYEISPQAFEICKKRERPNLHFILDDLLGKDKQRFDVVMAIDVFEHVEDYFGFLRKLKKKARYKIFHIPLDLSVQSVWRVSPILNRRKSAGHLHYFTKETALATLNDAGYDVVDHFYTCGALELSNLGWKANLMKLPRRVLFSLNRDLSVRTLGGFSLLVLAK